MIGSKTSDRNFLALIKYGVPVNSSSFLPAPGEQGYLGVNRYNDTTFSGGGVAPKNGPKCVERMLNMQRREAFGIPFGFVMIVPGVPSLLALGRSSSFSHATRYNRRGLSKERPPC